MASTTTNSSPVKILTVGSACGSIRDIFTKIKAIDAKHGKFDFALCIGDFFGPLDQKDGEQSGEDDISQLMSGKLEVPLKCYIMQGDNPLPEAIIEKYAKTGGELCQDLFLLNKSGVMTTAHGLRIACLGGIYNREVYASAETPPGFASPFFSTHTVERLLSNTLIKSSKNQNYSSLSAIKDTASSSQLIDVLISNVWPSCITQLTSAPLPSPDLDSSGAQPLDDVIRKIKPRYHLAAAGGQPPKFWEREPFVWDDESGRVSRFVSLGAFGGEPSEGKKQRWFYAFSIAPSSAPPSRPTNATKNPFTEVGYRPPKRSHEQNEGTNFIWGDVRQKRSRIGDTAPAETGKPPPGYKCRSCDSTEHFINDCPERSKPPEGYVCKICNTPGHLVRDCPTRNAVGDTGGRKPREGYVCRACGSGAHFIQDCPVANQQPSQGGSRGRRAPPKEIGPGECWFCLSNPDIAKHLIVSIGSECYLTLPKGQIVPTKTASEHPSLPTIPGGGHVLIVPITHHPTYTTMPVDIAPPIVEETEKYKTALRGLFSKHSCAAVFFEVGRLSTKGGHAHVQAIPVPLRLKDKVEEAFLNEGRATGIDFEGDAEGALNACAGGTRSYFRIDLPDGRKMVHLMKDGVPFSIQFGRQVLVSVLGIPDRFDWKACMLPEEDDKADAQAFKTAFAPFDPSL